MPVSLLAAAVLALGSLTVVAEGAETGTFIGCSLTESSPQDGVYTMSGTLDQCLSQGCGPSDNSSPVGPYIQYWPIDQINEDNNFCLCSFTGVTTIDPSLSLDPWATVVSSPQGQCDQNWEEGGIVTLANYLMTDDWSFNSCASTITPIGDSITTTQPAVNECWSSCEGYNYASMRYDTKQCTCANYFSYIATGCSGSSTYIWPKRGMPSASQLAKHRARALEIAARRGLDTPCPRGLEACVVPSGGLECLDTTSELESCGGCVHGSANGTIGTDCTALPGAHPHWVACRNSECVVRKCRPGWTLVNGACIRA